MPGSAGPRGGGECIVFLGRSALSDSTSASEAGRFEPGKPADLSEEELTVVWGPELARFYIDKIAGNDRITALNMRGSVTLIGDVRSNSISPVDCGNDILTRARHGPRVATGNSREALFDAMERRETYATTGPRMAVGFFSGWDFEWQPPEPPLVQMKNMVRRENTCRYWAADILPISPWRALAVSPAGVVPGPVRIGPL